MKAMQPNNPESCSDRAELDLLKRVGNGDRAALSTLYASYHPRLFKFVFRLTHSYPAADELVNDIMMIVWKKAATFRGDSKVSTWIFGIAYRQSLGRISKRRLVPAPDVDLDALPAHNEDASEQDWVARALEALPAAQQVTVILVFYLGLSYEEVSSVTDCPVNTVKTRMFHAKKKLKVALDTLASPVREGGSQG